MPRQHDITGQGQYPAKAWQQPMHGDPCGEAEYCKIQGSENAQERFAGRVGMSASEPDPAQRQCQVRACRNGIAVRSVMAMDTAMAVWKYRLMTMASKFCMPKAALAAWHSM